MKTPERSLKLWERWEKRYAPNFDGADPAAGLDMDEVLIIAIKCVEAFENMAYRAGMMKMAKKFWAVADRLTDVLEMKDVQDLEEHCETLPEVLDMWIFG